MVHFILGTAGTGKTSRLLEEIGRTVRSGRSAILLIPEQFSFEGEKLVYGALGPKLNLSVQVLSFTRLCNAIFRRFGGVCGTEASKAVKYLLMSMALEEVEDKLVLYKKSVANISFLETMLAVCDQFKSAGASPDFLGKQARSCDDIELGEKLSELCAVYAAYQALLERGFGDPEDCLIRACAVLNDENFFGGYDVYVDAFTAFMSGELLLLQHIMRQSGNVWFAVTTDTTGATGSGMELFAPCNSTVRELRQFARRAAIAEAVPEILTEPKRYTTPETAFLSKSYLKPGEVYPEKTRSVRIFAASDPYDEAMYAADEIDRLVREGMRYSEIAIISREIGTYARALQLSLGMHKIPCFFSDHEDIESKPLAGAVLSAIDAVCSGYNAQSVLALAKSPALGPDTGAVAELENYCYTWGISGAVWLSDFVGSPRGLADTLTEDDIEKSADINSTRAAIITPLEKLREGVREGNGTAFAIAIFEFLQEINAAANLTNYARQLQNKDAFLDENAQLWDLLMGILDVFGKVIGRKRVPWRRLCELFRLSVSAAELSVPPQTLDQVIAGNADRIRPAGIRACFVLGANEGVFPPPVISGGVFSDEERRKLEKLGIALSGMGLTQVLLERYFTYFALTIPSECLYVTFASSDLQGRPMLPSMVITQLSAMFPGLSAQKRQQPYTAGFSAALRAYSENLHSDNTFTSSLEAFLRGCGGSGADRLDAAAKGTIHALEDKALPKKLFGESLRLSPSKIERFKKCPYSFFAADGLGLQKRRRVEFSALSSGTAAHHVLHIMVQKYGGSGLAARTQAELEEESREIIGRYLADRAAGGDMPSARFEYLFGRLCGTLARLLGHIGREFAQGKFSPEAFEMPIAADADVTPLRLRTMDGTPITVEGVVDRVDVMRGKNGDYIRVVDYKSGKRDFKLQDIMAGLNLQMLLYLFTIRENGGGKFGDVLPAGVLYLPVAERFVSAARDTPDEEITREREKSWRMSGLLLEDEDCLRGMEADLAGVYIPAKLKKDGTPDSKSSLANLAQMGKLAQKVKQEVTAMGEALMGGRIPAYPVDSADYPACAYCDYRPLCGFEENGPVREIAKLDREEVLKLLEQEDS
ncbi:MAG: PD-(D/E)XK nuclease family protein [Oscillospiraceae bacterium]|nr:PD-(D/E)XK nuclease family protein [Oscillospiraceae bacterium]